MLAPVALLGVVFATGHVDARPFSFKTAEGFRFDGRVVVPPGEQRNGAGVLLIGGGLGNDLDWTVPGSLEIDGQVQQFTITGADHADAPRLAGRLVDAGFVVAHWSTIRRDDPKADRWPDEATLYGLPVMVEHARDALVALRALDLFDAERTILLGHSLGAQRAAILAADDPRVAGLVLLGPARAIRLDPARPRGDLPWIEDILPKRRLPTLILYGTLDRVQGRQAPALVDLIERESLAQVELRVIPGVGHNLGPELDGRIGPIDDRVLDEVARWLAPQFAVGQ